MMDRLRAHKLLLAQSQPNAVNRKMSFESLTDKLKKRAGEEVLHTSPVLHEEKLKSGSVTVSAYISRFEETCRLHIRVVTKFPAKKVSRTVYIVYAAAANDDVAALASVLEDLLTAGPPERDPRSVGSPYWHSPLRRLGLRAKQWPFDFYSDLEETEDRAVA